MKDKLRKGFTIMELFVIIAIVIVLASIIYSVASAARERAIYAQVLHDFDTMYTAIELYKSDHGGQLPPDADRNVPPGLGPYISGGGESYWPNAPWPGSVYDWDNLVNGPGVPNTAQISIRFCPQGAQFAGPNGTQNWAGTTPDYSQCHFPPESWAKYFQPNSSVYYCISGACRSHNAMPRVPGYCVNCLVQPDPAQ